MDYVPRRLLRGPSAPPSDAAGLLNGRRSAFVNPLKGKGTPPKEDRELNYRPAKHFIDNASFKSSVGDVLRHREELGAGSTGAYAVVRTALRACPQSYDCHLVGGGASVVAPAPTHKPMRRPATAAPRTDRVMPLASDQPAEPTYALLATARRDVFVANRPSTAPACVLLAGNKKQLRGGYELSKEAYPDVHAYRHSGGICPPEYKLLTERPAAPQLAPPTSQQARLSFFDSKSAMLANQMRSKMSDVIGH
ncbi:hypothetical protein HYH03_003044 [Edaphochlamys debaryana]|uniref:Uncharacterized protein n=1 Tax=Edaphochlamys debaryana TaxID=47281 RepID=A0A836C4K5_9CHLO|nr:hypothetical protein HYH03_003044 [Edaphochlamys debaryana]|eukprot:KAG2498852.1 hypothetical protein HYH03_003044 [Edaphochlamys debaryana]